MTDLPPVDERPLSSADKRCDAPGLRMFLCDSSETLAPMTETWSTEDVDNAVFTIRLILKRFRALPLLLLNAYRYEIVTGELTVTRRFYEQLALNCPPALDLFTASTTDTQDTSIDHPKELRTIPIE